MKKIVIVGITIIIVLLFSGCFSSDITFRGKITDIQRYIDMNDGKDITVLYLKNPYNKTQSYEIESNTINKYHLIIGQNIIFQISNMVEPYKVKNLWISD